MTDFMDQNGAARFWGAMKVFFQGRAEVAPVDADKIPFVDDSDTETVNGGTYKKYKTVTFANMASYVQSKIASAFAALNSPTFTGTPAAPTAGAGTNSTQIATTAFVQQELAALLGANDAMIFKGTLGTGGTITTLPTTYSAGWAYKVIEAAAYAGVPCEVGDMIIAIVDRAGSGNQNADWAVLQTNIATPGALSDATIDGLIV